MFEKTYTYTDGTEFAIVIWAVSRPIDVEGTRMGGLWFYKTVVHGLVIDASTYTFHDRELTDEQAANHIASAYINLGFESEMDKIRRFVNQSMKAVWETFFVKHILVDEMTLEQVLEIDACSSHGESRRARITTKLTNAFFYEVESNYKTGTTIIKSFKVVENYEITNDEFNL